MYNLISTSVSYSMTEHDRHHKRRLYERVYCAGVPHKVDTKGNLRMIGRCYRCVLLFEAAFDHLHWLLLSLLRAVDLIRGVPQRFHVGVSPRDSDSLLCCSCHVGT